MQQPHPDLTISPHLSARKRLIAQRFEGAQPYYDQQATFQREVCQSLSKLIEDPIQTSVLEVGAGSGQLTELLAKNIQSTHWHINELCQSHATRLKQILPMAHIHIGDAELCSCPTSSLGDNHSLIISANAIQWFDDPLSFIDQSARQLQRGGQLLFSTFTPQHFFQLTQLTQQGLYYPTQAQWLQQLDQSGLQLLHSDTHTRTLDFASPYEVLRHLKNTGVTAAGLVSTSQSTQSSTGSTAATAKLPLYSSPRINQGATIQGLSKGAFWNKQRLSDFQQHYLKQFGKADGSVPLTYQALMISAIKR